MQLKNAITLNLEPFALKQGSEVSPFKIEPIFAIIVGINRLLQYCNNRKSPLGNNRKT